MNNQFNTLQTVNDMYSAVLKLNQADMHPQFSDVFNKIGNLQYNNLYYLDTRLNNLIAYNNNRNRLSQLNNIDFNILNGNERDDMRYCVMALLNDMNIEINGMNNYHNNNNNHNNLINNINNINMN